MEELISIIIPVYNVENYIDKCINSVFNQTHSNLEIILIDDGSLDRSGEICDDYQRNDTRVKVIHKRNEGLSAARNDGIRVAQGKYLTFLDSDDWIHKDYIKRLHELINLYDAGISICEFMRVFSDDAYIEQSSPKIFSFSAIDAVKKLTSSLYVTFVIACGKLYRTELFDGICFPYGRLHEDEFVAHHILYKSEKVVYTTEAMLFYRQRPNSIMKSRFTTKSRVDAIDAFFDRANFMDSIGLPEERDKTLVATFHIYRQLFKLERKKNIDSQTTHNFSYLKHAILRGTSPPRYKLSIKLYILCPCFYNFLYAIYSITRKAIEHWRGCGEKQHQFR